MSTAAETAPTLMSYSEAGALLGIPRKVVAVLAARNGIVPKAVPSNALAKGVDAADLDVLREAWARVEVPRRRVKSVK